MTNAQSDLTARIGLKRTGAAQAAVRESVVAGAALTGPYLTMNVAAALIAGFGLLENSPAAIIGAMLIAMLFGPIIGIALALAEADMSLLRRCLVSELAGGACVLAIGLVLGVASRDLIIGSEILSRTAPSGLDLLIALVAGLAGGFTFVSTGLAGVVVGVAMAISLVPPLTTCGILLARHLPTEATGAFLLFLTNFTAIALGAMIVFVLAGHHPPATSRARTVLLPRLGFLALLVALGFHVSGILLRASAQSILQSNIRTALAPAVAEIPGARLVQVTVEPQPSNKVIAWAVVRIPQPVSPEQVGRLNDLVNGAVGRPISLTIRSVITAETTRDGDVHEPQFFPGEGPDLH